MLEKIALGNTERGRKILADLAGVNSEAVNKRQIEHLLRAQKRLGNGDKGIRDWVAKVVRTRHQAEDRLRWAANGGYPDFYKRKKPGVGSALAKFISNHKAPLGLAAFTVGSMLGTYAYTKHMLRQRAQKAADSRRRNMAIANA